MMIFFLQDAGKIFHQWLSVLYTVPGLQFLFEFCLVRVVVSGWVGVVGLAHTWLDERAITSLLGISKNNVFF